MPTKKNTYKKPSQQSEQPPLFKYESLKYDDFTSNKEIKSRYFVLINKSIQDKRVLSSVEEVKFAGRYVEKPIILGFRTLTEAKSYLAGPRLPAPKKKKPVKEFYSHKPHEDNSTIEKAREAHDEYVRNFNK